MTATLATARMTLRPFQPTDAPVLFTWVSDPEVMRFMPIPTGLDHTLEQTVARVQRYMDHQQKYGFSRWLIFDRASGLAIGDAGLLYMAASDEIELGYRFARPWWGQGRATEVAAAWLDYAFGALHIPALVAFAEPENRASLRVMEKLGMHFLRQEDIFGKVELIYGIQRPPQAEGKDTV
ncbi:MAG: N-acetyltransferase [Chloroflexi bacterium]|nr:MAG: N-acetyltransferase [Chloroflexota bacterium]